jgi:hypothetical protein
MLGTIKAAAYSPPAFFLRDSGPWIAAVVEPALVCTLMLIGVDVLVNVTVALDPWPLILHDR